MLYLRYTLAIRKVLVSATSGGVAVPPCCCRVPQADPEPTNRFHQHIPQPKFCYVAPLRYSNSTKTPTPLALATDELQLHIQELY
jgi:hypothetical protein